MSGSLDHTLGFIEHHGYALLFFWVLAEQSAIPLPSIPLLLAAGALIQAGRLFLLPAIACCVIAALFGDLIWFELGRHRGRQVLRLLCRVSLEPDSCVRQTENAFLKYGMGSLLICKFVPGLNSVAAPLAGASRIALERFVAYDLAGSFLWSGSCFAIGYLFAPQLETVVRYLSHLGANLLLLTLAALALWIGWKFFQRRRFLKKMELARITPAELWDQLHGGDDVFVVDLRQSLAEEQGLITGAVRISPGDLSARVQEIPRDRDIVLFCS